MYFTIESEQDLIEAFRALKEEGKYPIMLEVKGEKALRTAQQNKALHLWFKMWVDAMNDSGFDMSKTLAHKAEIPWTPESFKEYVWRPVQKAYTEKLSSTKLDKKQVSEVAEIVTRHLSQITGICIPFPEANHGG